MYLIISVILLVGWGITYYYFPTKLSYRKIGFFLIATVGAIVIMIIFIVLFEDQFFTKSNVKEILKSHNIELLDSFVLLRNNSSSAIGDYTHTFELEISNNDKNRLISEIKSSKGFRNKNESVENIFENMSQFHGKLIIQNFETEEAFVRRYFQSKRGWWFKTVFISKNSNRLTFDHVDE